MSVDSKSEVRLAVEDLVVEYATRAGTVYAVSQVSFELKAGETLGVVGESGCGKSTMARAVLQLPAPKSGSVTFEGADLTTMSAEQVRRLRPELQMVFQDPVSSLNPRRTVRQIVAEPLTIWRRGTRAERMVRADEMLRAVGLNPDDYGDRKPTQLSGGQCQRVAIARALVAGAKVLVCDEPVSSLDVSLRATVLNMLEDLQAEFDLSILFIAHDLAVVKNISDRVMVMYLGKVVEVGDSESLYASPAHPYTLALLESIPEPDPFAPEPRAAIAGDPPSPVNPPSGCRFRTRCPLAQPICAEIEPALTPVSETHSVACHFPLIPVLNS
ncbi:ATP-binding cassette domain-containing protein [Microbacterium sp. zg-Y818]|uniref:ABC transporter ATP-binding protein n=1 Tax=unclassified Microbacterium TaxID=2609290 RepID=UPI00214C7474|nr:MULTISPECIES: oligopeptide/dipeptide ABC transporter ATP-binding protein [unclassified Microbacterium]MCR2799317.1 ATP-binding cassette domain-containing protein [Microbacterium sp. zg.Y818]WIM21318.1 ATP-binding cassette domain-containing protein [Microbacterium sp. zg-Y818]